MHAYLACFDISDDRNRDRLARKLGAYGSRVQRSVFEISLRRAHELEALRADLRPLLEAGDDLRFYALCQHCRRQSCDVDGERVAQFPSAVII